jgi:peptidoglycan/LPS O-acetylase OafA/YrhL
VSNLKSSRYQELDSLRGIAAFGVMLFHYSFDYYNYNRLPNNVNTGHFAFKYGYLGVHLFFMISGFVIFMTLEKTKTIKDFIVSRFSRLFPTYWVAISVTLILTWIIAAPFHIGAYTFSQILVNYTMLQSFFRIQHIDISYWTLAVELKFYILLGLVFQFKWLKNIFWICLVWLFASAFVAVVKFPFVEAFKFLFILSHAPLFIAGIGFYTLKIAPDKQQVLKSHILILASLAVEMLILYQIRYISVVYYCVFMFFVVFYLFVYGKLKFLQNRILLFLGAISYPFYLLHQNIGFAIIYRLKMVIDNDLFYIPVTITIVIFLAWLISKYVEKPALKYIRGKF